MVVCDRRKRGGRGRKSTFTQSTLSLSEAAPKEVANVRSFPNVTDAHPAPPAPSGCTLAGPSLARLAYTVGNSFLLALLSVHKALVSSTDTFVCQTTSRSISNTLIFSWNGKVFTFLSDCERLRKACKHTAY